MDIENTLYNIYVDIESRIKSKLATGLNVEIERCLQLGVKKESFQNLNSFFQQQNRLLFVQRILIPPLNFLGRMNFIYFTVFIYID